MGSLENSVIKADIQELYALNIKALWVGLKQEHISFWFLCLYYLFEYIRPQSIYPAMDVIPWGLAVLFMWLVSTLMNPLAVSVSNPLNKLLVVFLIVVILSGFFAFTPAYSWDYFEVIVGWVLVYFLTIRNIHTEKQFLLFVLAYLLFNLKMAQFGAVNWIQRGFTFAKEGLNGSPGWFQNSGEYAIQMLIYSSLALAVVLSLREYLNGYKKAVLYLVSMMGFLAVMGASSRGSQLALVIIAIVFFIRQKKGLKALLIMGVLGGSLFFLLPEEQMQRFQDVGDDGSSLQRLAYWKAGLEVIKEKPILGVGYNNWMSYMTFKYPSGMGPFETVQVSHNIFIQAASELGIPGLLCFLLMILYAFINNVRTRRMAKQLENKFLTNISYGLDAGLVGYLIAGSFVTVLYYPFFWVQVAMIVALNSVVTKQWQIYKVNLKFVV